MSVLVREARPGDLDAMAALEAALPSAAGWSRAQLAAELGRPGRSPTASGGGTRRVLPAVGRPPTASGGGTRRVLPAVGRVLLVAELDGAFAGHAAAWLVAGEAQLLAIAVRPECVRRGVGRALLEAVRARARAAGCARLTLEVSERNGPARALYAAAGGRVVGRRAKFYNDGSDALLMDLPT